MHSGSWVTGSVKIDLRASAFLFHKYTVCAAALVRREIPGGLLSCRLPCRIGNRDHC